MKISELWFMSEDASTFTFDVLCGLTNIHASSLYTTDKTVNGVEEAAGLIQLCREKLSSTELKVKKVVEALAAGVPVVSAWAPHGPADILDDGETGLMVPTGNAAALGAAIGRLLIDRFISPEFHRIFLRQERTVVPQ